MQTQPEGGMYTIVHADASPAVARSTAPAMKPTIAANAVSFILLPHIYRVRIFKCEENNGYGTRPTMS